MRKRTSKCDGCGKRRVLTAAPLGGRFCRTCYLWVSFLDLDLIVYVMMFEAREVAAVGSSFRNMVNAVLGTTDTPGTTGPDV